jgi:hypothetical protein
MGLLPSKDLIRVSPLEVPALEMKKYTGIALPLQYTALETVGRKALLEKDLFSEPADLIIGIDATDRVPGRAYLVVNGTRVDGQMYWRSRTIKTEDWKLSRGLVIRYRNLPADIKARLWSWLQSNESLRAPTCEAAACIVLFERAKLGDPGKRFWFPKTLLNFLVTTGLADSTGHRLTAEIFTINEDIRVFWSGFPTLIRMPTFINNMARRKN